MDDGEKFKRQKRKRIDIKIGDMKYIKCKKPKNRDQAKSKKE